MVATDHSLLDFKIFFFLIFFLLGVPAEEDDHRDEGKSKTCFPNLHLGKINKSLNITDPIGVQLFGHFSKIMMHPF